MTDYKDHINSLFKDKEVTKIYGPAGTGKTTFLINELKALFQAGIRPEKIAFVSFTNKAVDELVGRCLVEFPYIDAKSFVHFKTIHALCYSFLDKNKKVLQQTELNKFAKAQGLEVSSYKSIEDGFAAKKGDRVIQVFELSRLRKKELEDQWMDCNFPDVRYETVLDWSLNYSLFKKKNNYIDFTDMLESFDSELNVDYVFIDECQDLSPLQWEVMDKATRDCKKILIAGDDDQSIYSWAGAEVEYILNIKANEDIILPKSYRLPKEVYKKSQTVLKKIRKRQDKKFTHNGNKGKVDYISHFSSVDYHKEDDCLVLARNRWQLKEIANHLENVGCPYSLFNKSSLSSPEMNAILSWENFRKGKELPSQTFKAMTKFSNKLKKNIGAKQVPKAMLDVPWFDLLDLIPIETKNYIRKVLKNGYKIKETPKINLSTIHQSKGGEAKKVVLLTDVSGQVWENIWRDCEHRVWYVAVTRAKEELVIVQEQSNKYYKL